MRINELRCDRCEAKLGENKAAGYGVALMVEYHHPKKLDLCPQCEKDFHLWLGKHPVTGAKIKPPKTPERCDNYQNEAFCQLDKGHTGDHRYDPRDVSAT